MEEENRQLREIARAKLDTAEKCKLLEAELAELNVKYQEALGQLKKLRIVEKELKQCKEKLDTYEKMDILVLRAVNRDLMAEIERLKKKLRP